MAERVATDSEKQQGDEKKWGSSKKIDPNRRIPRDWTLTRSKRFFFQNDPQRNPIFLSDPFVRWRSRHLFNRVLPYLTNTFNKTIVEDHDCRMPQDCSIMEDY